MQTRLSVILSFIGIIASALTAFPITQALAQVGDSSNNPLIIAFQGGAVTLDPIMRSESTAYSWQRHIFDTVTMRDRKGKPEPRIAVTWKNLSPLEWQLTLRQGVKFHDGSAMTADDVGKSIMDAATNPKSQMRAYVGDVKGYKVVDDHTIDVAFKTPDPFFPTHLSNVPVMPESLIAKEGRPAFAEHPIGTGPYKFVSWLADDHLTLQAWKGFWGKQPAFQYVRLEGIPNNATRVAALLSGQAQVVEKVLPSDFARVKRSGKADIASAPGERTMYLAMDYHNKENSPGMPAGGKNPFMQPSVRRAVSLAINRKLINQKIFADQMTVADQFLPASMEGYNAEAKKIPFSPSEAKKLLAKAGFAKGFKVRLDGPNDRYLYDSLVAQALAGVLGDIGLTVDVHAVPKAVFFPQMNKGNFTMYLAGWGSTDPVSTWDAMFHCRDAAHGFGHVNREHYCNEKADKLMAEASRTFDEKSRQKLIWQAYGLARDSDYAYLPLYYQNVIAGVAKGVGWKSRPDELILAWQMTRK